jgi:predicted membrane-bound mannosyltransferase
MAIFLVFVVASVLLVRRYTDDPWRIRLAAALVALWPYSFHNSVRVHNDTLVSTLMVLALLFLVRWQQDDRPRDLFVASGVIALALLTKSSAYVLVATLLVLLAHRLYARGERKWQLARAAIVGVVLAAAMFLNTLRKGEQLAVAPRARSSTEGAPSARSCSAAPATSTRASGSTIDRSTISGSTSGASSPSPTY